MARIVTGTTTSSVAQYETFQNPIYLVRGDTLPSLELVIKDKNTPAVDAVLDQDNSETWAPYDLTNAVILLKLRQDGATTLKESIRMYPVGDPTTGKAFTEWTSTALDTAGKFTAEIEITQGDGKVVTVFEQLTFIVREDY